jgi:hypothetical protein
MGKYFHYLLLLALLLHCLPAEATTYFCIRDHGPWLLFTGLDYWPTFALAVTIDFVALAKSFRGVRQQFVRFLGVVAGNLIVWLSYFLLFFYLDNRLNLKWLESNTFGAWFSLMSILVFCTWIVKFCSYSVLNWMHCEIEERFLGHSLALTTIGFVGASFLFTNSYGTNWYSYLYGCGFPPDETKDLLCALFFAVASGLAVYRIRNRKQPADTKRCSAS